MGRRKKATGATGSASRFAPAHVVHTQLHMTELMRHAVHAHARALDPVLRPNSHAQHNKCHAISPPLAFLSASPSPLSSSFLLPSSLCSLFFSEQNKSTGGRNQHSTEHSKKVLSPRSWSLLPSPSPSPFVLLLSHALSCGLCFFCCSSSACLLFVFNVRFVSFRLE